MIIETKFSIGDVVYFATTTTERKTHECPDCLGTRKWKAISPAGTEYTFDCPRCTSSYQSEHRLSLNYTQFTPATRKLTIGSVKTNNEGSVNENEYMCLETGVGSGSVYDEVRLFATEEEAMVVAKLLADEANSGGVSWVKEQYDRTLEIKDYQLADGRDHLEKKDLLSLQYKFRDLLHDIENCNNLDEVKNVVEEAQS